jgi:hypothetical protein
LKKLTTIILFISLIAPFIIGLRTYDIQIKRIKKSVKKSITENIDKNLLVRLSFNKDQITKLNWEHSKEFEYNSEMYDIVHKEIISDSVIYWCWLDKEETNLEKSLNSLIAKSIGKSQSNNPSKDIIKQLIKKTYINQGVLIDLISSINISNHYKIPINKLSSIPQKISSPPPEFSI